VRAIRGQIDDMGHAGNAFAGNSRKAKENRKAV
jgi:hypothetical protein